MPIPSTTNNKEASNKSLCLSVGAGNALYQGEFLSFFISIGAICKLNTRSAILQWPQKHHHYNWPSKHYDSTRVGSTVSKRMIVMTGL